MREHVHNRGAANLAKSTKHKPPPAAASPQPAVAIATTVAAKTTSPAARWASRWGKLRFRSWYTSGWPTSGSTPTTVARRTTPTPITAAAPIIGKIRRASTTLTTAPALAAVAALQVARPNLCLPPHSWWWSNCARSMSLFPSNPKRARTTATTTPGEYTTQEQPQHHQQVPQARVVQTLQQFGFSTFNPGQTEVIDKVGSLFNV